MEKRTGKRQGRPKTGKRTRERLFVTAVPIATAFVLLLLGGKNVYERYNSGLLYLVGQNRTGRADLSDFSYQMPEELQFTGIGTKTGEFEISNPLENVYTFQVMLQEKQSRETLYTSPKLAPGESIRNIALQKQLLPGSYEAAAVFRIYDKTTGKELGQESMEIKIIMEQQREGIKE